MQIRSWVAVSKEEMLAQMLSYYFADGIVEETKHWMYWSTDRLYSTSVFHSIMRKDRYDLILKYSHIVDNSNAPDVQDNHREI